MLPPVDHITMGQLSRLVEENKAVAEGLGLSLSFAFAPGKVIGRIRNGKYLPYEKEYTDPQVHVNLMRMHMDFQRYLEGQVMIRRKALNVQLIAKQNEYLEERAKQHRDKERDKTFWMFGTPQAGNMATNMRHIHLMGKGVDYVYQHELAYFSTAGIREIYPFAKFPKNKVVKMEIKGKLQDAILPNDIDEMTAAEKEEANPTIPPDEW